MPELDISVDFYCEMDSKFRENEFSKHYSNVIQSVLLFESILRLTDEESIENPRPNSVWHIDGHHKLIRWGIVVHGMVDGFCRTVSNR